MARLHQIHSPQRTNQKHVIFIHGLQGHYDKTWRNLSSSSDFWPTWLSEEIEGLAIWTVEYDAPVSRLQGCGMHLRDRARNILELIVHRRELEEGELIFVGHSLGGLVIKQLLAEAEDQARERAGANSLITRIRRVAFLATPHIGSGVATLGDKLRILIRPSEAVNSLLLNDPNLLSLNIWYRKWSNSQDIDHLVLIESKPHKILGLIVPPTSADPGLITTPIKVDEDHGSICKPTDKESEVYVLIRDFVSKEIKAKDFIWAKQKFGDHIQGWKRFGNWANCPKGIEEEYLSDDELRFYSNSSQTSEMISGGNGIQIIRKTLRNPGTSIRLTGLSGVGKTRLLQALFDDRVGTKSLNHELVYYSDISDNPIPSPIAFAEELVVSRKQSILAIDNCPPDLHRRLTSLCSASGSLISLITIEYDVREDQPEETDVFRLEPASSKLIERLIRSRFSFISEVDATTIAKCSGGNSRIAISLALTVKRGDDLSRIKDAELFERLFVQRNAPDKDLLVTAEVCSLVYSFDVSEKINGNSELEILSSLANIPLNKLYANISELTRRELVQKRGVWRAVLPHALSNRLSQNALENIPVSHVCTIFEQAGSERLLTSFSRRLSYLNNSDIAKAIIKRWIDSGILSDFNTLNPHQMNILSNISPLDSELVLRKVQSTAIKDSSGKFTSRENSNYIGFTRLLRSLAFDSDKFGVATTLLCQFAITEQVGENVNSIRNIAKSLFYIYLSGTHATAQQRLEIIEGLINSKDDNSIILGFELLDATLKASHFSSHYNFEFGAQSRDHGYSPSNRSEMVGWYSLFIDFTLQHAMSDLPFAHLAKNLLSQNFRGLWVKACMYKELEIVVKTITANETWNDGWLAAKSTLRIHADNTKDDIKLRLEALIDLLSPKLLIDQARLYSLSHTFSDLDIVETSNDDNSSNTWEKYGEHTKQLGIKISGNDEILKEILPELLSSEGPRIFDFGQGLAEGTNKPKKLWADFQETLDTIPIDQRNFSCIEGFLRVISQKEPKLTAEILDDAITNSIFSTVFPKIQASVGFDSAGVARLKKSLEGNSSSIWLYRNLNVGYHGNPISDEDLCSILQLILAKLNGEEVAIGILGMKLLKTAGEEELVITKCIIELCKDLLINCNYNELEQNGSGMADYSISVIIKAILHDSSEVSYAESLCRKLSENVSKYHLSPWRYPYTFKELSCAQPIAFLDGIFSCSTEIDYVISSIFSDTNEGRGNIMSNIPDDTVIGWCEIHPEDRYPKVAAAITPYIPDETGDLLKLSPIATNIITNSPDPILTLNKIRSSFRPMSWSGSRAAIMSKYLPLFVTLKANRNPIISEWASRGEVSFQAEIAAEREGERGREMSSSNLVGFE